MFYMQYLSSLCQRRQWPEPSYQPFISRNGVMCIVRVNNREYRTEVAFENDVLASENAAMRAYLICRNFSVNDGMYPVGHTSGGATQGLPVAIGRERRRPTYDDEWSGRPGMINTDWDSRAVLDGSQGSQSGGSSPGSDRFSFAGTQMAAASSRRRSGRR